MMLRVPITSFFYERQKKINLRKKSTTWNFYDLFFYKRSFNLKEK